MRLNSLLQVTLSETQCRPTSLRRKDRNNLPYLERLQ